MSHAVTSTTKRPPSPDAYISVNKDELYHYNGSTWVTQAGGGGGLVISLKCAWTGDDGIPGCTPPNCPTGWTSAGSGCAGMGGGSSVVTPAIHWRNIGYCERWCYRQ